MLNESSSEKQSSDLTPSFLESVLDDKKWNLLANLSFMMFRRLTATRNIHHRMTLTPQIKSQKLQQAWSHSNSSLDNSKLLKAEIKTG